MMDFDDFIAVDREFNRLIKLGWNRLEAFTYIENLEEFNPYIPEDLAVKRMQDITAKVNKRLGYTN